ncbi:hypothetical protein [Desulfolucanica intricata]|uniref:hypothetical protein n=1 Tax=Desulfolucanica intricata TaxID=1285191 RepID=UPI00082B61E6|nr:hypothetical protein [Desulfolucanica intricata]
MKENLIDVVQELLIELRKQGFMKNNKQTAFQKTEQLLYNYMNFKQVIADKQVEFEIKRAGANPALFIFRLGYGWVIFI